MFLVVLPVSSTRQIGEALSAEKTWTVGEPWLLKVQIWGMARQSVHLWIWIKQDETQKSRRSSDFSKTDLCERPSYFIPFSYWKKKLGLEWCLSHHLWGFMIHASVVCLIYEWIISPQLVQDILKPTLEEFRLWGHVYQQWQAATQVRLPSWSRQRWDCRHALSCFKEEKLL